MKLKLSQYIVASPAFHDPITQEEIVVVFSTRSTTSTVMSAADWRRFQRGDWRKLDIKTLAANRFLVDEAEDELGTILIENERGRQSYPVLFYVFQPTADCQLGCGYCGQQHQQKKVSVGHQDAAVQRIADKLSTGAYSTLEIGWFGAEPLLGLSTMRSLTPRLKELASSFGVQYISRLVTNGVTLDEKLAIELCEEHRVTYIEVTLDGDRASHDARRFFKSRRGSSFDIIVKNLVSICNNPRFTANLSIRCNVDGRNYQSVSSLIDTLHDRGIHERIREFYVARVHSWGNDVTDIEISPEEFASLQVGWSAKAMSLGFPSKLTPIRTKVLCMALKPDSELVDADGNLFNCTEASYIPSYVMSDDASSALYDQLKVRGAPKGANFLSFGHLDNPPADMREGVRNFLPSFYDRVSAGDYDCDTCPMLPTCGGACPKVWAEGGRPCPPAKFNLPYMLQLDYLSTRVRFVSAKSEREHHAA